MSKKIKKEIKRSLPWFVILCLLVSSTVVGLVFNFGFQLNLNIKTDNNIEFAAGIPSVKADTATTSVTVRNAPPAFTVAPAEYKPGVVNFSTSTTPVNEGDGMKFRATASDQESNDYFLLICDSPGATAHNHNPPTCDNVQFCVSASTTAGNQAECTYIVQDPAPTSETDQWYAYVCDGHGTEAACSLNSDPYIQGASPGNYASSSPFYINHAPVWQVFATSINNQDPGGTFEFVATSTETDVAGGADGVVLYVCDNAGYATSTGCLGAEYCHATSTAVGGVAGVYCQWTDTAPTDDIAYTVWGYIHDTHYMPADTGNGTTTTYTINNVAPTVGTVTLNSGNNISPNIKGAAEYEASTTAIVSDNNGCDELSSATSTIYWSSASGHWDCSANDNTCYKITSLGCTITGCSGADATAICTTTIAYHALPTDGSAGNPNAGTWWEGAIKVFDDDDAFGVASSAPNTVEMITTTALDVSDDEIPYRSIQSGSNSGSYNATTTVVNYGNGPIDAQVGGDDMYREAIGPENIDHDQQLYASSTFAYGVGFQATLAASSSPMRANLDITRPTSQSNVSDDVYWGIAIPGGQLSGDYYGENVFTATHDQNNWP